eukprot:TRINITY_DN35857_c0_g1_i1.p1 TRINITY_DN35857_c0_g1~~TRINITY_DN35857_c0_g1_i1.p1  ORF type:complete len:291 (+),score=21.53 TRINITY_DN35857_c0_g1_i1:110-982(+)
MPLMKIADTLQCPKLQNELVDNMEQKSQVGSIDALLKHACDLDLVTIAESLVDALPASQLTCIDFDSLTINSMSLMRAIASKLAQSNAMTWGSFVGHGHVDATGGLALTLPNVRSERVRQGCWCHAMGANEVLNGKHTWKLRVDSTLYPGFLIAIGIVSGSSPSLVDPMSDFSCLYTELFEGGAFLLLRGGLDVDGDSPVHVSTRTGSFSKWKQSHRLEDRVCQPGDYVTVTLTLAEGKQGSVSWDLNGTQLESRTDVLPPAPYRLSAELYMTKYVGNGLGVTLRSYTNG